MGILTRKHGLDYVISSDRSATDAPSNRPPKGRPSSDFSVWTGEAWSPVVTEAMPFATLDTADEYVRANFSKVTGLLPVIKPIAARRPKVAPIPIAIVPS